jgi:hypothetical protein
MREKQERKKKKEKEEQILCVAPDSTKIFTTNIFISNGLVYGGAFLF